MQMQTSQFSRRHALLRWSLAACAAAVAAAAVPFGPVAARQMPAAPVYAMQGV
jgi:hypothetical protein